MQSNNPKATTKLALEMEILIENHTLDYNDEDLAAELRAPTHPNQKRTAMQKRTAPAPKPAKKTTSPRILVVSDTLDPDREIAQALRQILRKTDN